jgi:hypothetical protein
MRQRLAAARVYRLLVLSLSQLPQLLSTVGQFL